jgi:hypothetical protein
MGEAIPVIAVGGGFVVAITAIVSNAVRSIVQSKHTEESRREIAAYVAEGTISPEDAKQLLNSGRSLKDKIRKDIGV